MNISNVTFSDLYKSPSRNGIYKEEKFHGSGWKIVNMGELFNYDFISNQEMNRVQLTNTEMRAFKLEDGDLLFGRRSLIEDGAGKCSFVINPKEPTTFESSIIRVRIDKEKVNPRFLFYYFKSYYGRGRVRAIVSGVNVKGIRGSDLKNIKLSLPYSDTGKQGHVVSLLSTYDNFIDTNSLRIQLLEESARLLFREWFVYFQFPNHDKVKIIDGVPEGWEKEKLNKLVFLLGGYAFKSSSYQQEGKYGIVTIKNVQQGSFVPECTDYLDDAPNVMKKHCYLSNGDILLSLTGNVGRVCLVYGENYLLNQRVAKIEPKNSIPKSFIYWMFEDSMMQKRIENLSYGSAQQNLSPVTLGEQKVVLPPIQLLKSFDEIVSLINLEIIQLLKQNQKLAQARDLLLPRLMNGAIEV